jgi:hypothetical protein
MEGSVVPVKNPSDLVVTTIRVCKCFGHDRVTVWNRGGLAGTLMVVAGDGETVARRLCGPDLEVKVEVIDS